MSMKEAEESGYRDQALGRRKCRSCRFAGEVREDEKVYCRMFEILVEAKGVCDRWAP